MSSPLESRVEEILLGATIVPQSRVEFLLEKLVKQIDELSSATRWIGVTTTVITDGSTTQNIVVDGKTETAKPGDICSYNGTEYIWSGSVWQEFGSSIVSDLAALVNSQNNGKFIGINSGELAAENIPNELPSAPQTNGEYRLVATKTSNAFTYSWADAYDEYTGGDY